MGRLWDEEELFGLDILFIEGMLWRRSESLLLLPPAVGSSSRKMKGRRGGDGGGLFSFRARWLFAACSLLLHFWLTFGRIRTVCPSQ